MNRSAAWVLGIVFGGLFLCLFGFLLVLYLAVQGGQGSGFAGGGDRVGVVEIEGPIEDSKRTLKALKEFGENDAIKAVVVRVDSPGGAVAPSQEIYQAIGTLKAKKKVIASMGSLAASGGYYIACAADKIYANPGTLTGSIGVVMQVPNLSGVLKWAGVEMNTITSGKLKDSGSPFRAMSPDERAYFEAILLDVHRQFIDAVAQGRNLEPNAVEPYADGRVFSGRQAKEWKLVDELGGIEQAVAEAARLGGIKGDPQVEYPKKERALLRELLGEEPRSMLQGAIEGAVRSLAGGPLQYRAPLVDVR